jgi:diguanylate cyclase (GGDEF)-like protein
MASDNHKPIPEEMIDAVGEKLPTFEEIERFASDGIPPRCCRHHPADCTSTILFALTRKKYATGEADRLWHAIMNHGAWLAERLGRAAGVSVAALDYLINVSAEWDQAVVAESDQIDDLTDAATLDGLTGLFVKDVFNPLLEKSVAETRRYGHPLSLLMADIDDFKAVNDTHGHLTGDAVLTAIGSDVSASLRSADIAARYGGEELAAVLPHTTIHAAQQVAEKIRRKVRKRFEDTLGVTISIGVAGWSDEMDGPSDLIEAADRALYAAKTQGKNRVVFNEMELSTEP